MDRIPKGVVEFVLENLKQMGLHCYELLSGTENKVNELRIQLNTLHSMIDDFTKKYLKREEENKAIHALMKEIRLVAIEADNTIQTYQVNATLQKNRDFFSKGLHLPGYVLDLEAVAEKIQKITMKLQDFFQNRVRLILELPKDEPPKDLAVAKDSTPMVGLQDQLTRVVDLLHSNKDMKLEAVSIIGMLGLGKTKLALQVKDHPKIVHTFNPPPIFVHVTHEYKRREVLIKMLAEIKPAHEVMNNMSDDEIKIAIQEELKDKRYMIVLDDVWEENVFEELKIVLPDNEGSKVLITSRNSGVAIQANRSEDSIVKLRELHENESMELLWREVFGDVNCREDLEMYGKDIVSKCGKLPMSIIVIAGILRCNRDSSDMWKDVSESVHSHVSRDENLRHLIGLSYHNLPEHLQRCFLYLGVFQEGSIPAWKLWQLWIAEGFVEENDFSRLEVTAKGYLEFLVSRNLVRVEKRRTNGQIKICRLHDTVRDFCKLEAIKLNLFREIRMVGVDTCGFTRTDEYCRGLCIHSYFLQYMATEPSHKFVRSFLNFCQQEDTNRLSKKIASDFTNGFKLLRVLDARSIIFPVFSDDLLHLVLLRYMSISFESNVLPEKVSNLKFLQTLIITKSKGQEPLEIRAEIWKMLQLRHLHTNLSTILCPPTLKSPLDEYKISPNMQTLTRISSDSCKAVVLKRTPNIKKLGVSGKLQDSSLFECLSHLRLLEDLRLYNEGPQKCTFLEAEKHFPEKLTKLTLRNTLLDWGDMSILAQIKTLEVLKLKDNAFVGKYWGPMSMDKKFQRLQVLNIRNTHLEEWQASVNDFPKLRSLILKDCRKLRGIPSDIGEIASLQSIELYGTNEEVARAATKIKSFKIGLNLSVHDSESTIDDIDSDEQIREENEPRALQFFNRILFCGKSPKSKNKAF